MKIESDTNCPLNRLTGNTCGVLCVSALCVSASVYPPRTREDIEFRSDPSFDPELSRAPPVPLRARKLRAEKRSDQNRGERWSTTRAPSASTFIASSSTPGAPEAIVAEC